MESAKTEAQAFLDSIHECRLRYQELYDQHPDPLYRNGVGWAHLWEGNSDQATTIFEELVTETSGSMKNTAQTNLEWAQARRSESVPSLESLESL